jgi:hypothetical protein
MLEPVAECLHDEMLQPLVARVFNIMTRDGLIQPASMAHTRPLLQFHLGLIPGRALP